MPAPPNTYLKTRHKWCDILGLAKLILRPNLKYDKKYCFYDRSGVNAQQGMVINV